MTNKSHNCVIILIALKKQITISTKENKMAYRHSLDKLNAQNKIKNAKNLLTTITHISNV